MDFALSDEQEQLRAVVRSFLAQAAPLSAVRRAMETDAGHDPDAWRRMARELALQSIHLPEEVGGQGSGFLELALVFEELGRALYSGPFLSSTLAGLALLHGARDEQRQELLAPIAGGEEITAFALLEPDGAWDAAGIRAEVRGEGNRARVHGAKAYVLDAHVARRAVVIARESGSAGAEGITIAVVDLEAPGVAREPVQTLDPTRRMAHLRLDGAPATVVGERGAAGPALALTLAQGKVCLAAEALGGAEACLDMAVSYGQVRTQFGRPIGSFQAVKHKCADMLVDVESARSLVSYAAWAADNARDELPTLADLGKAACADAYLRAAAANVQIHGGIGYTWEHDAHLYFKRATVDRELLGDPAALRETVAAGLLS